MRFTILVLVLVLTSVSGASAQWDFSPEQAMAKYGSVHFARGASAQATYTQVCVEEAVYVPQQGYYSAPRRTQYRPRRPSTLSRIVRAVAALGGGNNCNPSYGYGYGGGTYVPAQVQTRQYTGSAYGPPATYGGWTTNVGTPMYGVSPGPGLGGNGSVGMPTYSVQGRRGLGGNGNFR